ncbi:MAG: response regulator [Pseudomonadota bacterium]
MAQILIIDDSPTELHVFKTLLERHGFDVITAEDAEEGITRAQREQPQLILMDVIMPGMNGFQATRLLQRDPATTDIPVIIISTKGAETDRVWGLRQGAFDYLTKPVKDSRLLKTIKGALEAAV